MRKTSSCRLVPLLAGVIVTACFGAAAAQAVNLGDVPGNDGLSVTCPKVAYLGPMVTAWCTDKNNLVIKSEVDVRTCVDFLVVVDDTGQIRCKETLAKSN